MTQDTLQFIPLHKTFGAQCVGVDFSKELPPEVVQQVKDGLHKYGLLTFRKTGLTDENFVKFGQHFGELCPNASADNRVKSKYIGDPSNIHRDGTVVQKGELQYFIGKATGIFHVDKSYDPRRVRYTTLKCTVPVPAGTGGATEFADSRTAYDDLDEETKQYIQDKVGAHSIFESRRKAAPWLKTFQMLDPNDFPFGKFPVVETQPQTGRKDLYLAGHLHHIEGMDQEESTKLIEKLFNHATQPKYVHKVNYEEPGDFVIWDNLAVLHRAGGGSYVGIHPRDVRNLTIYDNSDGEWGFNDRNQERIDPMKYIRAAHEKAFAGDSTANDFNNEILDYD
ncbi:hypothetical protein AWJ20_483 [Sugiyamaella lignohabitans]|uniref:TauD/TfdA-like domain-containing protein n=1 Tax=Sugiyamaella lignohabitans TaxID=796027 RepID=A0A167CXQ7_9ASCO|nr:uncharacterized protein AWJ20_483 [Sugiyamaella lignohabitans]ANB12234.1 hypothetical protein AWJ20_483 [Sugiyamaella lignohabitans]